MSPSKGHYTTLIRSTKRSTILLALALLSCVDTHVDQVNIPLYLSGTELSAPISAVGEVMIKVDRADLAFGPLYLCAGVTAGDLCQVARLEWLDSAVVNTIRGDSVQVGELSGLTGVVLSWMYDLGISSQLTNDRPFILKAAEQLEGHSFALEGEATISGIEVPFTAWIVAQQSDDTELGVPIIRKSISELFSHEVTVRDSSLSINFDPKPWIEGLDLRRYVTFDSCTIDGPAQVCEGSIESRCDGEVVTSSRDCAELGQVCLSELGCQDRLIIEEGSEAYRSLRNAMIVGTRPLFTWNQN